MAAPFCMGILHGAVQDRVARGWGAFCRRGSLVSAGKTFFDGVGAHFGPFFRSFDRENNFAMVPLPPMLQIHRGYLNRVVSLPTLASLCFAFSSDTSLIFFPWRRFTAQWLMATLPLTSTLD